MIVVVAVLVAIDLALTAWALRKHVRDRRCVPTLRVVIEPATVRPLARRPYDWQAADNRAAAGRTV